MSEFFTLGIIDTFRSEYFDRFTDKRIRRQAGQASSGTQRFVTSVMRIDTALGMGVFPVDHQATALTQDEQVCRVKIQQPRNQPTPQDVRNSVMALFWPVWGLYWELYWELY
jgi:hypothetical protein